MSGGARLPGSEISVRDLAAFVHRRGDIHYRYESATLAEEGIARQRQWQRGRGAGYRSEVAVRAEAEGIEVGGRIDGWDTAEGALEEVKTTRADAAELHAHIGEVNLAQLRLYGGMLARTARKPPTRLRLVYLHPDEPGETVIEEQADAAALETFFRTTCAAYARWLAAVAARVAGRDESLRRLHFPHTGFRPGQRRLARRIYRALRDDEHLLADAPTGSGKTVAGVFPALKAMGEGAIDRLAFLTARTTGQRAAEAALGDLAAAGARISAVTITARARTCFNPELPCDPGVCRYAKGYFDRMPAARDELIGAGIATRAAVEDVARRHRVCPFELSADAGAWSDVVVGDYNYAFDPLSRYGRLIPAAFPRTSALVDEAHQLGERVADMLSALLSRDAVKRAMRQCARGASPLSLSLHRRLRSVDRALAALARETFGPARLGAGGEKEVEPPAALLRALERLARDGMLGGVDPAVSGDEWRDWFELTALSRAAGWSATCAERGIDVDFAWIARRDGTGFEVELACTTPGQHIRAGLARFPGSVRMSGTLRPAPTYQAVHGFDDGAPAIDSHAHAGGRLGVFAVPEVSTYFRDRERSLPRLVSLIGAVVGAREGGYLVAFPSFDYARAALAATLACTAAGRWNVRCQQPGMDLEQRADFIDWIGRGGGTRVAFVVMGGVFAESVDYPANAVNGVVVVGPCLPPRSLKRDLVARDAGARALDGEAIGYRQGAMARVVQAAGRVVRGPGDSGVVVLVDPRLSAPGYTAFFPSHWRPERIRLRDARSRIAAFWTGSDGDEIPHRAPA